MIERVSVAVHPSEIVTLIGPNGAGKTTLAKMLLGLVKPSSGTVARREGLRVGYVPQRFPVDWIIPLSVRRFMSLTPVHFEGARARMPRRDRCRPFARCADGGAFRRRVSARGSGEGAGARSASPGAGRAAQAVDFAGAAKLYELIAGIRQRRGCGILLISHDLQVVLAASDRVVCLNRHICCEGVPGAVAGHPEYVRLFGPEAARAFGLYQHHHDHTHTLSGEVSCCGPDAAS